MSKLKKLLAVLVCMAMVLAIAPGLTVWAEETPAGLTYEVIDGHAVITGYTGNAAEIEIPAEIDGIPVTEIGERAFYKFADLTSVTIPEGVTSIGSRAFYRNDNLKNITIPDSVADIGDYAFYACFALTDVTIPKGLTVINDGVFEYCTGLTSITIPDNVTAIGVFAFENCAGLTDVNIPDSVTSIGDWAFQYCNNLTNVSIGKNVTKIGNRAFASDKKLTGIDVAPENPSYTSRDGVLFNKAMTELIQYPASNSRTSYEIPESVTSVGNYAFQSCAGLTDVAIPDSVTSIGKWAFYECTGLTGVTIPEGVTSIGELVFYDCDSLTSVTIPESVTAIGELAFCDCDSLTNVTIPASVTDIGDNAFGDCKNLTSIDVAPENPSYTNLDGVLFNKAMTELIQYPSGDGRTSYIIPDSVAVVQENAFAYCENLSKVTIGAGVTSVGPYAFSDCAVLTAIEVVPENSVYADLDGVLYNKAMTELVRHPEGSGRTSYEIPDSVITVGSNAFYNGGSLTSVKIGDGVTTIGENAFYGCSNLTNITIPRSVTVIDMLAFDYCDSLADVYYAGSEEDWANIDISYYNDLLLEANFHYGSTGPEGDENVIPEGLTYEVIDGHAVITGYTGGAAELTIPAKIEGVPVTEIGERAFYKCVGLTRVTIPNGVTSIGSRAFFRNDNLKSITIPDSVANIGDYAFQSCTSLTSVTIPKGVTVINMGVFDYCISLTSITIPDNVTEIGVFAFENCDSLTDVTVPDSVTSIGTWAFQYCDSLANVSIGKNVTKIGNMAFSSDENLTSIDVAPENPSYASRDGVLFDKEMTHLIQYPTGNDRTSYEIPDGVTTIGDYAFGDCYGLTNVNIPDSVTTIGSLAFNECDSLTDVTIPESVTSIGDWAFQYCDNLTNVSIGKNVTEIGELAFASTKNLTSIDVAPENPSYTGRDGVLFNKTMTELIQYPAGDGRTSYEIPDSVAVVQENAFTCCENLSNVTIGAGVTSIGPYVFYDCAALTAIEVVPENSVYADLDGVLYNKAMTELITYPIGSGRTSYEIPDSVITVGSNAFYNSDNLTSVKIGDGVTAIDGYAFYDCSNLTNITIPRSVTVINLSAFDYCDSLADVYYAGSEEDWANIDIFYCNDPLLEATIHYNGTVGPKIAEPGITIEGENLVIEARVDNIEPGEPVVLIVRAAGDNGVTVKRIDGAAGSVTFPAEDVKTVKVFAWESLESMRPLCPAKEVAVVW